MALPVPEPAAVVEGILLPDAQPDADGVKVACGEALAHGLAEPDADGDGENDGDADAEVLLWGLAEAPALKLGGAVAEGHCVDETERLAVTVGELAAVMLPDLEPDADDDAGALADLDRAALAE